MEKYSMTQEELATVVTNIVQKVAPYTSKETVLSLLNQELDAIDKDIDFQYVIGIVSEDVDRDADGRITGGFEYGHAVTLDDAIEIANSAASKAFAEGREIFIATHNDFYNRQADSPISLYWDINGNQINQLELNKNDNIMYDENKHNNELKAFTITCTVEGKYKNTETGQSFDDVVIDANDDFLNEEDRTDLYSLEHDEWVQEGFELEYTITAKVSGVYEVKITADSENDAIDKAEWEYDSADFGDLDNLDRGDFEIQDVNDDEYTLSCEVEGVFSTVITAESLEAALEDAEDEYNESSFVDLINPERDDFEADDVDYTLVCNVSALYSETIYAFNVYDAVKRFKEIVHDECDFPNDFDGDFEVTYIGNINIDSEKIQSSKGVADYLLNSSYRLVAERYNWSAELRPNIPFTENINNISDDKEISDIIYSNLSKGISTAEGREALKQFLKNELAVNSDPVECRGIENNLLPAIDELNALSGKDFTPYGISPDMDKLVDSNNIDDRISAANNCYGLDKLINDECDRVRMAVAAQGYGKDILVYDTSADVRAEVAYQGYMLDYLQKDVSQTVRNAVYTVKEKTNIDSHKGHSNSKSEILKAVDR